jgi:glycosyltransferase involved in cell wall biosynthesis
LGWSAVSAANRLGIPVFSGFHTNYHSYSRHYRLGWLHHLVFRYLCEFHNRTVGTFVPSPDLRNRLETLGVKNVSFLGRGVDSQLFAPERRCSDLRRQWGVSDSDLAVAYVGRLAGEKKVGLAVDAFRAMKRLRDSMKLVIVGDGPLRHAMQKENPDVIFCGMQTGEQLARHYASADLFVFPSETETFGNVTLEAMASGLAVIAFDYAAAKIHIKHGETGLLVPYGDSKAFVDTSADLIREPRSLQKIRQQAREYAAALSWQHVVARFENLLRSTSDDDDTAPKSSMPPADFAMAARGRV